ncbi:MAG: PQQ-binding-like beta-propeller repeat protein [Phycisphaerales bacterium]|nr:MAG: PQQ-binding-like beta-propeller repeat protein [Phycisphaerales bacterium]
MDRRSQVGPAPRSKRLLAIKAEAGDIIWEKSNADTYELMPTTLCVQGDRVYFQSTSHILCIDARTGQVNWRAGRPVRTNRLSWSAPTLVVHEDVVLSADCSAEAGGAVTGDKTTWKVTAGTGNKESAVGELIVFSIKDGSELRRCETALGYNSPPDVFVANDLVWTGNAPGRNTLDFTEGRDLRTGQVKRRLESAAAFTETHHHRCYRNKATNQFILLGQTRFYDRNPQTGEQPEEVIEDVELPGTLPDVLVCDGDYIYLRDKVLGFDGTQKDKYVPHLYSSVGLLDDSWWHRTYWLWGERNWGRASGWHVMPNFRPSGRILVSDEDTVFGYGRRNVKTNNLKGYHLFRADKKVTPVNKRIRNNNKALVAHQKPAKVNYHWSRDVPVVVRGMVLAGDVLFATGPVMTGDDEPAFDKYAAAEMLAFDTDDGRLLSRCPLDAQPVFDGMAAAGGRLYVSTLDGKIMCLGR